MFNYYYTCGGSDADQAGDHALHGSKGGGLAEENSVKNEPRQQAGGGADVGVKDGQRCVDARHVRISAVESRPPHPQQPRSCQHHHHVVRRWKPLPVLFRPGTHLINLYDN